MCDNQRGETFLQCSEMVPLAPTEMSSSSAHSSDRRQIWLNTENF